ncbi:UNVERIFIED_CONTAM: hypothetical protein RMT77_007295 [Armadillidium vulgare]
MNRRIKRIILIWAVLLNLCAVNSKRTYCLSPKKENPATLNKDNHDSRNTEDFIDANPWLVSLQDHRYDSPRHFCGGVIIDKTTVLTTAFCVRAYKPRNIQVVAGEDNMEEQSGSEQFVNVTNIIIHEDFSSFSHKNDIAILKVSPQFRINKNVSPVDLKPYVAENYIGEDCNIHGWKITEQKGFVSPVLRQKMIEIISDLECHKMYPGLIRLRSNICGLNVGFQTTCYGDYGGPLICNQRDFLGIASWSNGCERDYPVVFVNVRVYLDWIREMS